MAQLLRFPSSVESTQPTPLVPVVPVTGRVPDDIDAILSDFARSDEASDPPVRNALFTAYWPRLQRTCFRTWRFYARHSVVERQDVEQEAFLVFSNLMASWPGNGSFTGYLLGLFPFRLRDAVKRLNGPRSVMATDATLGEMTDSCYAIEQALEMLEDLTRDLDSFDRQILVLKIREERSLAYIASTLGVNRRTVQRRWRVLGAALHQELRARLGDTD